MSDAGARWDGPSLAQLQVDRHGAAHLVAVSERTWARLVATGQAPRPTRLSGRIVRWNVSELVAWCAAGCPSREAWEAKR